MKHRETVIIFLLFVLLTSLFSQTTSKVYFTRYDEHFGRVYSDDLSGGNSTILINNINKPSCIAIDWSVNPHKMYVGLDGENKIVRYDIDGTNPVDVVTGQSGINDIELNLESRRIFWLKDTYSDDYIYSADMDGTNSNITEIYHTTTDNRALWGLALDVPNNRLWITERGSNCMASKLRRMTLSGGSQTTLDNNICNPHDIEYYNNRIYFLMDDGLVRAETDGTSQTLISTSTAAGDGLYLAIDGLNNKAYWTYSTSVCRVNLDGTGETTIFSGVSSLLGIDTDFGNPAALPVKLTFFTATSTFLHTQGNASSATVVLNWQTATEVNNYGFDVERQTLNQVQNDIPKWETIGFVEGHGNSNSPKDYSFIDSSTPPISTSSMHRNSNSVSYRLKQIDIDGAFEYSDVVTVELETPREFNLSQNYPNPFNPTTMVSYTLPTNSKVKVEIFNTLGQSVAVLVNGNKSAGYYEAIWNAQNLPSGIYFINITTNGINSTQSFTQVKKALLLK